VRHGENGVKLQARTGHNFPDFLKTAFVFQEIFKKVLRIAGGPSPY
jgi:hypothetical protein